jgi:hypothetical protein
MSSKEGHTSAEDFIKMVKKGEYEARVSAQRAYGPTARANNWSKRDTAKVKDFVANYEFKLKMPRPKKKAAKKTGKVAAKNSAAREQSRPAPGSINSEQVRAYLENLRLERDKLDAQIQSLVQMVASLGEPKK